MTRLRRRPAWWWGPLVAAGLVWLVVSPPADAQVLKVLEGSSYGPVVMMPETEVVFRYTILCAANLRWGMDPCSGRSGAAAATHEWAAAAVGDPSEGADTWFGGTGDAFNFAALSSVNEDPLTAGPLPELGAAAPMGVNEWALFARLVSHWAFDGEIPVRAAYGPPPLGQPFIPLGPDRVELMRFSAPAVEDIYVEIKVVNGYSVPMDGGYLLGVELQVERVP